MPTLALVKRWLGVRVPRRLSDLGTCPESDELSGRTHPFASLARDLPLDLRLCLGLAILLMDVSERILEVPGRLGIPGPPAEVVVDRRRRLRMAKLVCDLSWRLPNALEDRRRRLIDPKPCPAQTIFSIARTRG